MIPPLVDTDTQLPLPLGVSWFVKASRGPVPYRDKEGRLRLNDQPLREGDYTRLVCLGDIIRPHGNAPMKTARLPHLAAFAIPEVTSQAEIEEDFMTSSDYTEPKKRVTMVTYTPSTSDSLRDDRTSPVALLSVHIAEEGHAHDRQEIEGLDPRVLQQARNTLEYDDDGDTSEASPISALLPADVCESRVPPSVYITPRLISVRSPMRTKRPLLMMGPARGESRNMLDNDEYLRDEVVTGYARTNRTANRSWLCACLS